MTLTVEVNIAKSSELSDPRPTVVPLATTPVTLDVTRSVKSKSVTVSVPALESVEFVSVNASAALSPASIEIAGASLVPVIVTVTFSVSLSGEPSSSVALTV